MTAQTYRSTPVTVRAVQWTGDNEADVRAFCSQFHVLDDEDRANCDDPEATGQLLDRHSTWKLVFVGDWIVDTEAGFVKMSHSAFTAQFDAVGAEPGS